MTLSNAIVIGMKFVNSMRIQFRLKGVDADGKEVIIEQGFPLNGKGFYAHTLRFAAKALNADGEGWVTFNELERNQLNITVTEKIVEDKKYQELTY